MTDPTRGHCLTGRYAEAFSWALKVHNSQTRHNTDAPYISHLMSTSALALENGADQDVAIAALLHDVVEDQNVPIIDVARRFGTRVGRIVADCTDVSLDANRQHIDWRRRKIQHVARMRHYYADSLLVIAADKTASLQALIDDITVYGMAIFRHSQRSVQELNWNYSMILETLEEKRVPIALLSRLRISLSQLRELAELRESSDQSTSSHDLL